jgi:hypothetical protein
MNMNENDGIVIGRLANRFRATYWEQGEAVLWAEGRSLEEAVAALNDRMTRSNIAAIQPDAPATSPANAQRSVSNEPMPNCRTRTAHSTRHLGMVGKWLAKSELVSHGFTSIPNLNGETTTNSGADIYAQRGERRYWICVKTRNKYAINGNANPRYKIEYSQRALLLELEQEHPGTEAAFIAISLVVSGKSARAGEPPNSYSCYFSPLRDLNGTNGIGMLDQHLRRYECLAFNKPIPSEIDTSDLENESGRRT